MASTIALSALRRPSSAINRPMVTKSDGTNIDRGIPSPAYYSRRFGVPPLPYGLQRLLLDARRRENRHAKRDQGGVPEAGAQAPPRRQPGRQGGRGAFQGAQRSARSPRRSREAPQVRRAGRQLAAVRAGGRAAGCAGWGRVQPEPGGFHTMTQDEMNEMFGGSHPFSDFFETFFGGAGQTGEPQGRTRGGRSARAARAG